MRVNTIVLDMDEVMVDMLPGAFRAIMDRSPTEDELNFIDDWDHKLYEATNTTRAAFWRSIRRRGPAFWEMLQPTPWAFDLYRAAVAAVGVENVLIATSPIIGNESLVGKWLWLQRNLGTLGQEFRNFAITPRKYLMGGPGKLLIDDNQEYIDKWRERGGQTIVWPQLWNERAKRCDAKDASEAIEVMKFLCEEIEGVDE